jgi:hypothetical protein
MDTTALRRAYDGLFDTVRLSDLGEARDGSWNADQILARIIEDHTGRGDLIAHVRSQATVLCDIADQLSGEASSVLISVLILSNGVLGIDQPMPLADLITGLAEDHIPRHTQQLLETSCVAD